MKISIDGKEILTLTGLQKKVIQNDIPSEIFDADMVRRLRWCVDHPCDVCCDQRKKSWNNVLRENGIASAPADKFILAEAVFRHAPVELPRGKDKELIVSVDGREVFRVSPTQKRMMKLTGVEDPDAECHSKMAWVLSHKYERCMERLRNEWEPRLVARGMETLPTSDEDFAGLVFAQSDYKDRTERMKDEVRA